MTKRLFVGNLPSELTEDQLHELFTPHGHVVSTKLIMDFNTGHSRRFGFVEMSTEEEAKSAIEKMNKSVVSEKELVVNEARPRPERTASFSGGGRGGYGGNSRGGYGGGYAGSGNGGGRGGYGGNHRGRYDGGGYGRDRY